MMRRATAMIVFVGLRAPEVTKTEPSLENSVPIGPSPARLVK
jgi:hypothetical protein